MNMITPLLFIFILLISSFAASPCVGFHILGISFAFWFFISLIFNNIRRLTLVIGMPTGCCYGGIYSLLVYLIISLI